MDPDQARRFVGPDLGPNCLQRLPADDTKSLRVNLRFAKGAAYMYEPNREKKNPLGHKIKI